jgi:hypothetical protein
VHGQPLAVDFAGTPVTLYPVYHPAAALYTRAMLGSLQDDFARLPDLVAPPEASAGRHVTRTAPDAGAAPDADQLGLF